MQSNERAAQKLDTQFALSCLALGCTAASTGTAIPSLRALMEQRFAADSRAAGAFVACHVLGALLGACVARALFGPSERRVALRLSAWLLASAGFNLLMLASPTLAWLLGLRFVDGVVHVLGVSLLMAIGTSADAAHERQRQSAALGVSLVLGVGAGIGLGGLGLRHGLSAPFVLAAALNVASCVVARCGATPRAVQRPSGRRSVPWGEALPLGFLVLGERFGLGVITIALPFLAETEGARRASAALLGTLMLASVLAMPVARRLAARYGALPVAHLSALCLSVLLFAALLPLSFASQRLLWAALTGACAGSLFTGCLAKAGSAEDPAARASAMAQIHGSGSLGYALGTALCGVMLAHGTNEGFHPLRAIALLGGAGVLVCMLLSMLPGIMGWVERSTPRAAGGAPRPRPPASA